MVTFLKRLLPQRNYGLDFWFSGNNENIKCALRRDELEVTHKQFGMTLENQEYLRFTVASGFVFSTKIACRNSRQIKTYVNGLDQEMQIRVVKRKR